MRHTIAVVLLASSSLVGAVGCKGETKFKDSQATLDDLDGCHKQLAEKDKLIADYESDNKRRDAQGSAAAGAGSNDIVINIANNVLTVTPPKPGGGGQVDTAAMTAAATAGSKQFIDLVSRSRGAIQKCYEQALRKDTSLQARTVTLTVSASFGASGAFASSSFAPSLGENFNACMHTITTKWALPTNSPAMTFKAPVSLTPS